MAKFIQVPTARGSNTKWRINVDNITYYDGTWMHLNCGMGKLPQTVSSDELDHLIRLAEAGCTGLIPAAQVPVL